MQDIRSYHRPKSSASERYHPSLNEAAHDLSLMGYEERADIIEQVVAKDIEHHTGVQATVTPKRHAWDITVALDDPEKVEVKSALLNSNDRYNFCGIKLEAFDYLFIVFVTPNGTVEKWAYAADVAEYVADKDLRIKAGKCQLSFTIDNVPWFFYDLIYFPYGKWPNVSQR